MARVKIAAQMLQQPERLGRGGDCGTGSSIRLILGLPNHMEDGEIIVSVARCIGICDDST